MKYTIPHRIAAGMTAMALLSGSIPAHATDLGDVTYNVGESIKTTPNALSMVCYLGGLLLGTAGILKLKHHSDAPTNIPVRDGVSRLVAGGALFAAPYVGAAIKTTISGGSTDKVTQTGFCDVGSTSC